MRLGFTAPGLGLKAWSAGFKLQGLRFRAWGPGFGHPLRNKRAQRTLSTSAVQEAFLQPSNTVHPSKKNLFPVMPRA